MTDYHSYYKTDVVAIGNNLIAVPKFVSMATASLDIGSPFILLEEFLPKHCEFLYTLNMFVVYFYLLFQEHKFLSLLFSYFFLKFVSVPCTSSIPKAWWKSFSDF